MIKVVATMEVKEGALDFVKSEIKKLVVATRQEEGCISYTGCVSTNTPNTICFVEEWESQTHIDAHFESAHIKAYRAATGDMFAARVINFLEEIV